MTLLFSEAEADFIETHRAGRHMTTRLEIGVTWQQEKECQQPLEAGRGKEQILPYIPHEGVSPVKFQNSSIQTCERINFCCLKPPSL